MAGESPDRSKQHESSASSAEATSGTPAAVPGPIRSAAADPRLAVARERAATVRVDQATAVFSTRALAEGSAGSGEKVSAGAGEKVSGGSGERTAGGSGEKAAGGSGEKAAGGSGEKGSGGDARLRAVVAAWVSGAEEESEVPQKGGSGDVGAGETEGAVSAAKGAETAAEDSGTAGEDADGVTGTGDRAGGDATGAGDAADAADGASAEGSAADNDAEVGSDAPDGSDDAGTSADTEAGEVDAAAESEAAADADRGVADGAEADTDVNADSDADSDSESAEEADPSDAVPVTADGAKAAAGAKSAGAADDADADADSDSDSDSDSDEASGSGDDVVEDAKPAAETDAEPSPKDSPKPLVDQPTAVFKTPRRPAVDQPTTMLKLGDVRPGAKADAKPVTDKPGTKSDAKPEPKSGAAAKADAKPDAKAGTEPKPDPKAKAAAAEKTAAEKTAAEKTGAEAKSEAAADPERTSRFVALRSLDERAPAKPRATPSDATAALPQVGPERTTQQPLPPKPPLDLLAELTNTPPPPQTPVRTLARRVKIWTPLVLLLAVIFAIAQAVRPLPSAALGLSADDTYTFEGGTLDLPWPGHGQSAIEVEGVGSLGTDGKQTPAPIASVAKIMTAYVILQEHPLKGNEGGEKITVDQQAEDESKLPDESTAAMSKGQQFTERQMLQMLMIPSGNNAARLLARWDSDSKSFVAKMNAAAKKLGMTNSTYTDPSGLQKTTVSTATDQLKLAREVMRNDVFRGIVGMASAQIPGLDTKIYNNNDLLVKQVGVIGLKTGSSTPAGGNLVWAATKTVNGKQQTVYGAVLGQNAGTGKVWDSLQLALSNSQKLIDKVQKSLTSATVVKKGDVVGYVDDQLGGRTPVVATKNMTAVGWPGLKTKLSIGAGDKAVPHTGKAGDPVGVLTVGDGSSRAVQIPVALQKDLAEPGFTSKLTRVG
ncbi:D-alanyl-D-alanine carboxypeptidase [Streptomyces sp. NBC_01689]|uniref:D-alanyl-D-alanine carboxypeptidase n=1 Tax=Streptomyces sp. NBC_01689 TaxID=2975911 RepID=UPI002E2EC633|nr:serine hydrolase [Streptomyces sp. NBC_01689]